MATKSIAWQTGSGNILLTYTGQGDGNIVVSSDANNLGTSRSQTIIIQTTQGGVVTKNLTVTQAACPFPVGDVKNYAYTGSYQEVELPAGQYKLQCWGAQGGSNAAASSYGITAQAGGKGGYAEGIITLSQKTTVRVYVGGQGSASAGGFNGGGSTTGTSQYNASDEFGYSKMGGGGGATDIRLSDGALLSRIIVAGGGAGGAMCYRSKTTTTTSWVTKFSYTASSASQGPIITVGYINGYNVDYSNGLYQNNQLRFYNFWVDSNCFNNGDSIKISITLKTNEWVRVGYSLDGATFINGQSTDYSSSPIIITWNKQYNYFGMSVRCYASTPSITVTIQRQESSSSTTTSNDSQVGFVGGGTTGGGYTSTYQGKQSAAGTGGSFGQGANQTATNYRYCSGAGGGGWYGGGGGQKSDSSITYCKYSGGGSGFVNTAASSGNRPSGYTGLQLDSGSTTAGSSSFSAPSGGNETGHAGNGYARITRLQ